MVGVWLPLLILGLIFNVFTIQTFQDFLLRLPLRVLVLMWNGVERFL